MTEYQLFGRNILIKRVGCGNGDSMGAPIPPSLNLFVKVTNGCNANCLFCSNAGHTQERHQFDVDKLFACIDEILNQRIILMTDLAILKSISPIRKNSMGLFL